MTGRIEQRERESESESERKRGREREMDRAWVMNESVVHSNVADNPL
jgi:hypothetical protein